MKNRYSLVRLGNRGGMFYAFDGETKKRESLNTKDRTEAERLLCAKNDAVRQVSMNLQLAQVYLKHSDPGLSGRTWSMVMEEVTLT